MANGPRYENAAIEAQIRLDYVCATTTMKILLRLIQNSLLNKVSWWWFANRRYTELFVHSAQLGFTAA